MAAASAPLARPAADSTIIGLIALAHFFSHLYILALPPLFPVLAEELGVGATALGLALAPLNLTTILCQPPLGFLVDRIGAAPILIAGHVLMAGAVAAIGLVPGYGMLVACMVAAGFGNAVYHPADYAILAARVRRERVGRAFAVHTFGGYLGFAAAPVAIVALTGAFGWRTALLLAGGAGLLVGLVLLAARAALATPPAAAREGCARPGRPPASPEQAGAARPPLFRAPGGRPRRDHELHTGRPRAHPRPRPHGCQPAAGGLPPREQPGRPSRRLARRPARAARARGRRLFARDRGRGPARRPDRPAATLARRPVRARRPRRGHHRPLARHARRGRDPARRVGPGVRLRHGRLQPGRPPRTARLRLPRRCRPERARLPVRGLREPPHHGDRRRYRRSAARTGG